MIESTDKADSHSGASHDEQLAQSWSDEFGAAGASPGLTLAHLFSETGTEQSGGGKSASSDNSSQAIEKEGKAEEEEEKKAAL